MKLTKKRILSSIAAASLTVLFACGDDKSSSPVVPDNVTPTPNSSETYSEPANNPPDAQPLSSAAETGDPPGSGIQLFRRSYDSGNRRIEFFCDRRNTRQHFQIHP